ncbi:MAG TPA: GerMN domain-containing protein [Candidatus Jeotgalibaca pullicola]|nr:GerMN domain-containing protein [Candidatus Jeotgalibaca pullicola]
MKKNRLLVMGLLALFVTGCTNADQDADSSSEVMSSEVNSESSSEESSSMPESEESSSEEETASIGDYFPFMESIYSSYLGDGIEYSSYELYPQYIEENRIQYVEKNSGTNIVTVLEYTDGQLVEKFVRPETYFRENMLDKTSENAGNILLQEPLEVGNNWENPSGGTVEITAVDVDVETPLGVFPSIEVTTTEENSINIRYYSMGVGLVKKVATDTEGSYEVTSTLEEQTEETPEAATIKVFFPDANAMGIETADVSVAFFTNDVTRETMTELLRQVPDVEYGRLIPEDASINSMYLNEDGRVYVDFSQELVANMNAGSSGESLLLQGIVNTIGTYYGVEEVVLTIEGAPYESGHYSMQEDESFKVDMEGVAE